jgi:sodium transport system ATP-binding protein
MIELTQLHKSFGAVAAVRGVSFTAPDGRITGLLGENGAGKTTTLALTCGLMSADQGSIRVGSNSSRGTPLDLRRRVGALLDHKGLYDRLTARENIEYFGRLHGLPAPVLGQRVDAVVHELGLERIVDRRTGGFSQGERMKVALARAIVHSPAHLLLDEPTNGLDIPAIHALRKVLRRMRDEGACIVFSSHVLEEVRALCDNVVIISRGLVVAEGDAMAICRQAGRTTLEEAFVALTAHQDGHEVGHEKGYEKGHEEVAS